MNLAQREPCLAIDGHEGLLYVSACCPVPRDPWWAAGTQSSPKNVRLESYHTSPLTAFCLIPGFAFQPPLGFEFLWTQKTSSHSAASVFHSMPSFTPCPRINLDVSLPGPASPSNIDSSLALKFFRDSFLCYSFWPLFPRAAPASFHRCIISNGISGRIQALPYALIPSPLSFKVYPLSHPTGAKVSSCRNPSVVGGATYFLSFPSNSQLSPLLCFWFASQLPLNCIF